MKPLTNEVAIGQKIKEIFDGSGMKIGDFADKLGMVRQNVYRIFERTNIDTGLLLRISELLEHNFFQYYTKPNPQQPSYTLENPPVSTNTQTQEAYTALATELAKTKSELELANKEIMYLKKIIDLMEERAKWLSAK